MSLEKYFEKYRNNIIGIDAKITTPYHDSIKLLYADWTASGRNYKPIEDKFINEFMPLVANTHTETNHTGMAMTLAYHKAREIIKKHVGASNNDVLISSDSGMTGVVNKFQRILGLKIHEIYKDKITFEENDRPIVFVTHMEHHSNQTSWMETIADVVVVPQNESGLVCMESFENTIKKYQHRKKKYAAITSCSNVTGIQTPYMDIAQLIHKYNGYCFADFACSAPYVNINMHEQDENGRYLDAIFFSPHKFLGGPGSAGVVVFNKNLYTNVIPDHPGGGTVNWTNPWGLRSYIDDIEEREDGGTPGFLQTIRTALAIKLKEEMGVENIQNREEEIISKIFKRLSNVPNIEILASQHQHRLGVISFNIIGLHFNAVVKLLNDRFGIQTRGGCSCAGTYGHYLLNIDRDHSERMLENIVDGTCSSRPGWVRMSIHPTHTDEEIEYLISSVEELALKFPEWMSDYNIELVTNKVTNKSSTSDDKLRQWVKAQFDSSLV